MRRREFLMTPALALASAGLKRLQAQVSGYGPAAGAKTLIIVELNGGNDGFNTLIPGDDAYFKARAKLAVPAATSIRLTDSLRLAPELAPLLPSIEAGLVAMLPAVGYPVANRSHFRSMDIWQSAVAERDDTSSGWLGRLVRAEASGDSVGERRAPRSLVAVVDGPAPLAFRGAPTTPLVFAGLDSLKLERGGIFSAAPRGPSGNAALAEAAMRGAATTARSLERAKRAAAATVFPGTAFGKHCDVAARLLRSGFDHSVMWLRLDGFDTHAAQAESQPLLLATFAAAIAALIDDVRERRRLDDTVILVFSEFGRRLAENASRGTDHGAAGALFVIGGRVRGGIKGPAPCLTDLIDGDLKPTLDFRSIYRAVLRDGLGIEASDRIVAAPDEGVPALFV